MGKDKNAPAKAGATSKEVVETPVVETPVVETPVVETPVVETPVVETPVVETPVVETPVVETPVVETPEVETVEVETPEVETLEDVIVEEVTNEAEVIPSNIFVAEDGTQVEFAVKHFIYGKKKYTVEEAVAEIPEALQELYDRKSFIFKKV